MGGEFKISETWSFEFIKPLDGNIASLDLHRTTQRLRSSAAHIHPSTCHYYSFFPWILFRKKHTPVVFSRTSCTYKYIYIYFLRPSVDLPFLCRFSLSFTHNTQFHIFLSWIFISNLSVNVGDLLKETFVFQILWFIWKRLSNLQLHLGIANYVAWFSESLFVLIAEVGERSTDSNPCLAAVTFDEFWLAKVFKREAVSSVILSAFWNLEAEISRGVQSSDLM